MSGAEPYTLAMVLAEWQRQLTAPPRVSILGTDLCTEVLQVAARGIYPASVAASVPAELCTRYLLRSRDAARARCASPPNCAEWCSSPG